MTTATLSGLGHFRHRTAVHEHWWIPDESPGGLGDREIWIDESALDMYGRGDAAPAVTVTGGRGSGAHDGNWWLGAVIRFTRHPGLAAPAAYVIRSRRWSLANNGRPYYVATRPD